MCWVVFRLDPSSSRKGGKASQPRLKITKEEMAALMEADARSSATERQLVMARERQAAAEREKRVTETTLRVISDLPEVCVDVGCVQFGCCARGFVFQDTRMYDAIGKMFLLKPKPVLTAQLTERIESGTQMLSVSCLFHRV